LKNFWRTNRPWKSVNAKFGVFGVRFLNNISISVKNFSHNLDFWIRSIWPSFSPFTPNVKDIGRYIGHNGVLLIFHKKTFFPIFSGFSSLRWFWYWNFPKFYPKICKIYVFCFLDLLCPKTIWQRYYFW